MIQLSVSLTNFSKSLPSSHICRIIIKRQEPFMEEIFRERKERKQRQEAEKEDNVRI
jgi:hypothetical protein